MPRRNINTRKNVQRRKSNLPTNWPKGTPENHSGYSAIIAARFGATAGQLIECAYEMSKAGHRLQRRQSGERYFNHPRAVSIILLVELMVRDWRTNVKALLHDIREDTHLLSAWAIEKLFGTKVLRGLSLLTKDPEAGYLDRLRLFGSTGDIMVKLADRLHNIRTLGSCDLKHQKRQLRETRRDYRPLADLLIDRLPPETKWRGEYLRRELEKAVVYWETHPKRPCSKPKRRTR